MQIMQILIILQIARNQDITSRKVMNNNVIKAIILIAIICFTQCRQISIKNRRIVDQKQRKIYFHGTNVVSKVPPYIPRTDAFDPNWSFVDQDIKILKQNGFNAIRLGVMWAGVEPKKDYFNQTYLEQMVKIVNKAGQAGIYTLVQFHQDLFSEKFCGDGVPIWLVDQMKRYKTFPFPLSKKYPVDQKGLPKGCGDKPWSAYYFSYDVAQGFNQLYNTKSQLFNKFTKYWQKVAEYFKGNPYVIAYELINEPWVGNMFKNPLLLIPSVAQTLKFQNFYDELSYKIREIDNQTPLCFQPITFDNWFPTGLGHPPGGKKYENSSIFCYHYYQPPELTYKAIDISVKNGVKLNIPSLLSQTYGDQQTLKKSQQLGESWMYWLYKGYGSQTNNKYSNKESNNLLSLYDHITAPNMNVSLVRTYFQRVEGQLINSNFDPLSGHFVATLWAKPNKQSNSTSVLFIPKERIYQNKYEIACVPNQEVDVIDLEGSNYLEIIYKGNQTKKLMITVTKL